MVTAWFNWDKGKRWVLLDKGKTELGYHCSARIMEKPGLAPVLKSDSYSCSFEKRKLWPGKLGLGRDKRNGVWVDVGLQLE
jgi:hypothetical protein